MVTSLYCVDISFLRSDSLPARGRELAHKSAIKLLEYAVDREFDISLPEISLSSSGKPFFSDYNDIHFSYSHTRTHVLCALSRFPVGADIETHRNISDAVISRIASPSEIRNFTFFELWTLRESLYKLRGKGNLLSGEFSRSGSFVTAPISGVYCRVYDCIPNCTAAVVSPNSELPFRITDVPITELFPNLQQI